MLSRTLKYGLFFQCWSFGLFSQSVQTQTNNNADYLVKEAFIAGDCFDVANATLIGNEEAIGTFSNGLAALDIEEGIILSTGDIANAHGPNTQSNTSTNYFATYNDSDILQLIDNPAIPIYDLTVLEFDFVPTSDFVSFDYVFASEEYCDFVNRLYNDVFGFFISGPGINGPFSNNAENIATVPGSSDFVSIDNVNHLVHPEFYMDNIEGNDAQLSLCSDYPISSANATNSIEYDGFTTKLTASINLIPCETYRIKLVIADVTDGQYDSAVFLSKNSFSAGASVSVETVVPSSGLNIVQEGCEDAYFLFKRFNSDLSQSLTSTFSILPNSTATSGVDYNSLLNSITFLPGETEVVLPVNVLLDNQMEGLENILLELDILCSCNNPFIDLQIQDGTELAIELEDAAGCDGGVAMFSPIVQGGLPPYQYEWSNGSTETAISVTPTEPASIYNLSVTDACGSEAFAFGSAIPVESPSATLSGAALICNGNISGALILNFQGDGPYEVEYAINAISQEPIVFSENPANLPVSSAGFYNLLSLNTLGCIGTISGQAEVEESTMSLGINAQNVSCAGEANGQIQLEIIGGSAPFQINWNTGQSDIEFLENLSSGNYQVTIQDVNACEIIETITIEEPPPLFLQIESILHIDCNESLGAIEVSTFGGQPPYQYNWNENLGSQEDISQLEAGIYELTITDGNNCIAVQSIEIENNAIEPHISIENPMALDCQNLAISIDASASSQGANFTYEWFTEDGNILLGANDLNPLVGQAGTYTLSIFNQSNGCANQATVIIEDQSEIPALTIINPDAYLNCEQETIQLEAVLENASDYLIEWIGPEILDGENTNTPIIGAAGNYQISVTNIYTNCAATASISINSNYTSPEITFQEPEQLSCTESNIPIYTAISGSINYSIEWTTLSGNILSGNSTATPIVNQEGFYQIKVTDLESFCSATDSVLVETNGDFPIANAGEDAALNCIYSSLALDAFNSSTGNQYSYQWISENGQIAEGETTLNPTVNAVGTYQLMVTDNSNGCKVADFVEVIMDTIPPEVAIIAPSNNLCQIGQMNLSTQSNNQNLNYNWSSQNGSILSSNSDSEIQIQGPGIYALQITDLENGCTNDFLQTIEIQTDTIENIEWTENLCEGNNTTLFLENSFSNYQWSTGAISPDLIVQSPGIYEVTVTDEFGCDTEGMASITQFSQPIVEIYGDSIFCPLGTATLNAGSNFETYSWSNGSTDSILTTAEAGLYEVTVTDQNGCSNTDLVEVMMTDVLLFDIEGENQFCEGTNTTLQVAAEYETYLWSTSETMPQITISAAGNYSVSVSNEEGCAGVQNINVIELPNPTPSILGNSYFCEGESVNLTVDSNYETYQWSTESLASTIVINQPGIYQLQVIDEFGCLGVSNIQIEEISLPIADAGLDMILTCNEPTVALGSNSNPTNLAFQYIWEGPGITNTNQNSSFPIISESGVYYLTLLDTAHNCTSQTDMINVELASIPQLNLNAPNTLNCKDTVTLISGSIEPNSINTIFNWSNEQGELLNYTNPFILEINTEGWYIWTAIDTLTGCLGMDSVQVFANEIPPTIQLSTNHEILNCYYPETNIHAVIEGQNSNFDFEWHTPNGQFVNDQETLNPLINQSGIYTLIATSASNFCTAEQSILVNSDFELPLANAGANQLFDCNESHLQLDGSASAQGGNIMVEWTAQNGDLIDKPHWYNPSIEHTGIYTIQVTNVENGCSAKDSVEILPGLQSPTAVQLEMVPPTCYGDQDGAIFIENIESDYPPFKILFEGQDYSNEFAIQHLSAGIYNLHIEDAHGCILEKEVTLADGNDLVLDLGEDQTIQLGDSIRLRPLFNIPETEVFSLEWSTNVLECDDCLYPFVKPFQASSYTLKLMDLNECVVEDRIKIYVQTTDLVYIPNAFSPNGDGMNDHFIIYAGSGVKQVLSFKIFDRWGSQVFEANRFSSNDPAFGWDGRLKGNNLNAGVFIYSVEIEKENGVLEKLKGEVNLIR